MVQELSPLKSHAAYASEGIGENLGRGLSEVLGDYMINKSLDKTMNDEEFKNAPMSQKMSKLQMALQPHGEKGQKVLQQRMEIAQQEQRENVFAEAQKVLSDPTKSPQEKIMSFQRLAAGAPGSEQFLGSLMNHYFQNMQLGAETANEVINTIAPNASAERKAAAEREGELIASRGGTPAQIKQGVTKKLTDQEDMLSTVKDKLTPSNVVTRVGRELTGTEVSRDEQIRHDKQTLRPLIESGQFDDARAALAESYRPLEQRERTLFDISDNVSKAVDSIPKIPEPKMPKYIPKGSGKVFEKQREEEQIYENQKMQMQPVLNNNVKQILDMDPNANLILLREKYEKNNYDWKMVRDAVTSYLEQGGKLSPDNKKLFDKYYDQPPISGLDKIFYQMGFRGR